MLSRLLRIVRSRLPSDMPGLSVRTPPRLCQTGLRDSIHLRGIPPAVAADEVGSACRAGPGTVDDLGIRGPARQAGPTLGASLLHWPCRARSSRLRHVCGSTERAVDCRKCARWRRVGGADCVQQAVVEELLSVGVTHQVRLNKQPQAMCGERWLKMLIYQNVQQVRRKQVAFGED